MNRNSADYVSSLNSSQTCVCVRAFTGTSVVELKFCGPWEKKSVLRTPVMLLCIYMTYTKVLSRIYIYTLYYIPLTHSNVEG